MLSRFAKLFCVTAIAVLILAILASLLPPTRTYFDPWTDDLWREGSVEKDLHVSYPHGDSGTIGIVGGGVIMSKLGNETAKAELGRATRKLLHTMTLRFPEMSYLASFPTPNCHQREALSSYVYLTSRLYPCGECAAEFQELLKKFPPQTSNRRAASLWLCSVHNDVSARLGKPNFDCAKLDETYDCGCGDAPASTPAITRLPISSSGDSKNTSPQEWKFDAMDLEWDTVKDEVTGVGMIKGGKW
ncbi:ERV/ALR sulfhydryl oxidase domain-containing protein [Scleroderma yunnanense]